MSTQKITDVISRLMRATGASTQAGLADWLGTRQPSVARAIAQREIPELWFYKVAEKTGRTVEWLKTGHGPELKDALVQELIARTESLKSYTDDPQRWGKARGNTARLISDLEMLVHLAERASIAAEPARPWPEPPRGHEAGLSEEDHETIARLVAALRSGDQQIRTHLIGQLRLIDELIQAKRAAPSIPTKKTAD